MSILLGNITAAVNLVETWRKRSLRIVLANGTFDPIHAGHAFYCLGARQYGDRLIVAVNDDASVRRLKGPGRPILPIHLRLASVALLEGVDAVFPFPEDDLSHVLTVLKPDVHCKGGDYPCPEAIPEYPLARQLGVESRIVGGPKIQSSSRILKTLRKSSCGFSSSD